MSKITFKIHLMKFTSKKIRKGKNQSNRVHLCRRDTGFSVVNAFLLRESLRDQTSLVAFNNTIESKLGLVNPLTFHNIPSLQPRNKFPSLIILQRINFNSHRISPFKHSFRINISVRITGFKNMCHQCNTTMLFFTTSLSTNTNDSYI